MKTRPSPSVIAHEVSRRIPLHDYVSKFDYKRLRGDEHTFPAQSENLRHLGSLSVADLYEFADWKSSRNPKLVKRNDDAIVQKVTRAALGLVDDPDLPPSVPIAILTTLKGVRVATASVLLTVWDPTRFGIIDVNAWSALALPPKRSGHFAPTDYDDYINVLSELRQLTGLTARQIDMALWAWWKEHLKERNTEASA